jgi:hypothetical protein
MKKLTFLLGIGLLLCTLVFGMSTRAMADIEIWVAEDANAFIKVASGTDFALGVTFTGVAASAPDFTINNLGVGATNGVLGSSLTGSISTLFGPAASHTIHIVEFEADYNAFGSPAFNVNSRVSGTYPGEGGTAAVTFQSWENATNGGAIPPGGTATSLLILPTPGFSSGGSFDTNSGGGVFNSFVPGAGLFSVTDETDITMAGGGDMNFSNHVTLSPVPEPATMLLLGSGLLGMGVYARKRFKK